MASVLKNTFFVGALTSLSRVLGLVREMLQSRLIGAGVEQSAFTLAFALPNMFRKLFGEGALTAAFIPVFRGELEAHGREHAARLARAVMTMLFLVLASLTILALGGLGGALLGAESWGFSPRARLTLSLVTILFPYMFAICGAAFGMGVLNALGCFKASGFMPALLNIVWIVTLAALALFPGFSVETRIRAVAGAILLAGFLQMFFMLYCMAKAGIAPRPLFAWWRSEKVRLVWHNLGLAALGAGAVQVNYALDQVLAQLASSWAAGVIGYAERLMDLPLGVIGVAFGTVLLPTFSASFAQGDFEGARRTMSLSVRSLMFLMIPSAAGLFALAPEITGVVYEAGAFDSLATLRVSRALCVYALGLAFFGLQKTLIPWFHAQKDMRTPLRVSLLTVVLNALLNLAAVMLLPEEWRHVGLAGSTVICALVGCLLLIAAAHRRKLELGLRATLPAVVKIFIGSLVMMGVLFWLRPYLVALPLTLALGVLIVTGLVVYGLFALFFLRGYFCRVRPTLTR